MEVANIYTTEGKPIPSGGERKVILTSGDRLRCVYFKRLPSPDKDIMEGATAHPAEIVYFVIEGEVELSVAGEMVTLKKGDAMLIPNNALMSTKVISTTPAEILSISCPNELLEKLLST